MKILGAIILALVALFTGGCSLLFAVGDLTGSGLGVAVIWGPGLLIAGLGGWGAVRLLRNDRADRAGYGIDPSEPPDDKPHPPSKW